MLTNLVDLLKHKIAYNLNQTLMYCTNNFQVIRDKPKKIFLNRLRYGIFSV